MKKVKQIPPFFSTDQFCPCPNDWYSETPVALVVWSTFCCFNPQRFFSHTVMKAFSLFRTKGRHRWWKVEGEWLLWIAVHSIITVWEPVAIFWGWWHWGQTSCIIIYIQENVTRHDQTMKDHSFSYYEQRTCSRKSQRPHYKTPLPSA